MQMIKKPLRTEATLRLAEFAKIDPVQDKDCSNEATEEKSTEDNQKAEVFLSLSPMQIRIEIA